MARLPRCSGIALFAGWIFAIIGRATATSLPTAWRTGIATNYGGAQDKMDPYQPSYGTLNGGCGYGVMDKSKYPYWSVAALSTSNLYYLAGPLGGCGECFEIMCIQDGSQFQGRCNQDPNARSVTVMISDNCPECGADHIDIQALTFNKIAPMALGRIQIQYRRVECAPPAPINVIVDQNQGFGKWMRLMVTTAAGSGSVKLVQIKGRGTEWQDMKNYWGGAWEVAQTPLAPLDLRIVAADGSEVTALGFLDANGQKGVMPTAIQFSYNINNITAITTFPGVTAMDNSAGTGVIAAAGTYVKASASSGGSYSGGTGATPPPPSSGGSYSGRTGATPLPPSTASNSAQLNQIVSAFEGPTTPVTPQQGTTSLPPAPPPVTTTWTQPPTPPSPKVPCTDTAPPWSWYPCSSQKQWGKCNESWLKNATPQYPEGYCMYSCGRC